MGPVHTGRRRRAALAVEPRGGEHRDVGVVQALRAGEGERVERERGRRPQG